ncbi:MAG TPA: signal recognition particle-docking protein FtsY [Phycisphaerae bacterium]|nr:signal recognition particle-docking protein FtsY [Phycisphaerae bacterium]
MGLFDRFKQALGKTRDKVVKSFRSVLPFGRKIDEDLLQEIHDTMLQDDFGPATANGLVEQVRAAWKAGEIKESQDIVAYLKRQVVSKWPPEARQLAVAPSGPTVILVAGINGSGKTTSVAKLANYLKKQGKKVVLAACDTYRAAAVLQLTEWSNRCGVDIVKHEQGADPGAVAYDACEAAAARKADILLVDTAGRLHTQDNLMRELNKIQRVVEKKIPGAPHEVLLVLDATIGQNAVNQARSFSEHVTVSGIILAKLDGSAKGGIVVGIRDQLNVPVKFVGLGEQIDDIEPFDPETFVEALFAE